MQKTDVQSPIPTAELLGFDISLLPMEEVKNRIRIWIEARIPSLIVTADAAALVIARDNPRFAKIIQEASLVTADGAGILWAMRRSGHPECPKVSGVELAASLCAMSADHGYRIFLIGAEPGIADQAAERLRLQYPGCMIVGVRHGYFPSADDEIVAEEMALTNPDIVLAAMGMPRQEEFLLKTQPITGAPIGIGVGGSLDVFSGRTKRAPRWVQAISMEWLWRLLLNPKKYKKVQMLPRFALMVLRGQK